ncbi:hypothetical protein [Gordonia malaquae]|uniref:hypothetical protein n=1 Tax=Gordonia malaquae TaxID=410332 RepID=UPI0030185D7E
MSALDSGDLGTELVTDLAKIAAARETFYQRDGIRMPLQEVEKDAGLTENDIWRFLDSQKAS